MGLLCFSFFLLTGILIAVVALRILAEDRVPSAILMLGVSLWAFDVLLFHS